MPDQDNSQPQADSPPQADQPQDPQSDQQQPSLDDELADVAAALDRRDRSDPDMAADRVQPVAGEDGTQEGTEETKEQPAKTEPKPSAWASLRKREQTLVEKQNQWQQEREDALRQVNEWKELQARCKDDPFAALRAIGWEDGKEFLQRIADSGGQMTPEQKRIYELEKQVAEDRKTREQLTTQQQQTQQQQQIEQNTKRWHSSIRQHIDSDPELKDSLVGVPDTEGAVFQVMQAHYEQTGEQMDYSDAARNVANNLENRIEGVLNELLSNKRGLELVRQLAAKIDKPAPARHKAPRGITQNISNTTSGARQKPRTLDEIVAEQAAWLDSR